MEIIKNKRGNFELQFTSNVNSETAYSQKSLGTHDSTMELWLHDGADNQNGSGTIEWDVPSLDETVHIRVVWENGEMIEFDGVFSFPNEAADLLEHFGVKVDRTEFCD